MPRRNPVNARDLEIGRRLAEYRKQWKCPRSYLASQVGLDSAAIMRIELGRVPLKYGQARSITRFLNINPVWLATGRGLPRGGWNLPELPETIEDTDVFSGVMDFILQRLLPELNKAPLVDEARRRSEGRSAVVDLITLAAKEWCSVVRDTSFELFYRSLLDYGHFLAGKYAEDDWKEYLVSNPLLLNAPEGSRKNILLTDTSLTATLSSVRTLHNLIDEADGLAKGRKAELAKHLGVAPETLSRYLSGTMEPGGAVTLKLLSWVESQRCEKLTQQKTPGSVEATPKGESTLRKGKVSETKPFPKSQKKS